jgi:hypothetical protein
MSITIKEALKLKNFRHFQLIAGEWGLENRIEKIGILDHEIVEDINGEFSQGDFVLTSFTPARNNVALLIKSIQSLIKSDVSGLAIKNIYFKELPPIIVNLANKMNFPIFIFDDTIFYEDIIAEINEEIRSRDNDELLATKIDILLKDSVSKGMIRELALELNHSFKEHFLVCFCKEKKYIDDKHIMKLLNLFHFQVHKSIYHSVIKYRDGILIICTTNTRDDKYLMTELEQLIESIGIENDYFVNGISNMHHGLDQFSKGIHEALYAVKSTKKNTAKNIHYTDIGIHQILMPFIDNDWIQEYSERILRPLIDYDTKYHTQILETAIAYIEKDQNIKRTAEALYQHDNTIRYRIKKMKEILDMTHLEGSFNEQLSIAVKIYLLRNGLYS